MSLLDNLLNANWEGLIAPLKAWAKNLSGAAVVYDADYADLATAVTAIGATPTVLIISTAGFLDGANTTVPATMVLRFVGNGSINQTHNLTILSDVSQWPLRKIFTGSGTLSFTGNKSDTYYPQWNCACDGTTVDTTAYQALLNAVPNGVRVLHASGVKILLDGTITLTERRSLSIVSLVDARNSSTLAPQFIWNSTGSIMFDLVRCQTMRIEGHYFKLNSSKTINSFIRIDGSGGGQISTENTIQFNTFDASNQANASAKLISISPTATTNNENMVVSYNDFTVSNASGASAVGTGIENSTTGTNPNAKHQRFHFNNISQAAIGIYQGSGSCDVYFVGGGSNGVDVKLNGSTEPCRVAYIVTEASKMAFETTNGAGPITLSHCRFSNFSQNSSGFLKLDGVVIMEYCLTESTPPGGGKVILDAGTGNLYLHSIETKWWNSGSGMTMAQVGYDLLLTSAGLRVDHDYGVTDGPTGFFSTFTNRAISFQATGSPETTFPQNVTTPSVHDIGGSPSTRGGDFVTNNTNPTAYTNFTVDSNAPTGMWFRLRVNDPNTSFVNGATLKTGTGANLTAVSGLFYTFIKRGTVWYLIGYSPAALSASDISSGTLAVTRGGTGVTTSTGTGSTVLSASPTLTGTVSVGVGTGGPILNIDGGTGTAQGPAIFGRAGGTLNWFLGAHAVNQGAGTSQAFVIGTYNSLDIVFNPGANVRPLADNANSFGTASFRWSTIYAATGTINTSDATEKRLLQEPDQKFFDAILSVPQVLFQWKDSIQKKGADNARFHYGPTAQGVRDALSAAGFDPGKYGLFVVNEVVDDEGEKTGKMRFGLRLDQYDRYRTEAVRRLLSPIGAFGLKKPS